MSDQTTNASVNYNEPSTPSREEKPKTVSRVVATSVVAAILLAGALTFNFAVAQMDLRFRKIAMPLRQSMWALDSEVGPWVKVTTDTRFNADIEKELGTTDYVQRTYVDTRDADPKVFAEWNAATQKTDELRRKLLNSVAANNPLGIVNFHAAYYTGGVDTVPHIPDRCMVGAGFETTGRQEVDLPALPDGAPLTMSFLQFEQRAGQQQVQRHNVAYVFKVNGDYEADAITGVRLKLQDLRISHAYFAKIEVSSTTGGTETDESQAAIADFLTYMLPAVDECLPVWPPEDAVTEESLAEESNDEAEENFAESAA